MQAKIILNKEYFSYDKKILFTSGELQVELFKYSTGIEAVTLKNSKGYLSLLPFMGQMVWEMEFLGHNLTMKSIFNEPEYCKHNYGETYGCFLMHCGLTAMGNPTQEDTHLPHGELPIANYKSAYVLYGEDEKGKYISLSGVYTHKYAYELDYEFSPEVRLYENSSVIDVTVNFTNHKDVPLEYFYLCHINFLPVDGAELIYTADPKKIIVHREVPDNYNEILKNKTNEYIDRLNIDQSIMNVIDSKTQSYAPEIVFTCKYDSDSDGNAHTMQLLPDGYSCYVSHRPSELPFGMRWISRTEDEQALGMVLPATAEHKGYLYCKERGYEKILNKNQTVTYHIKAGILSPDESDKMKNKIKNN